MDNEPTGFDRKAHQGNCPAVRTYGQGRKSEYARILRAAVRRTPMAGDVIEMSSVKAQLGQACMAAAAAELATMQAVKPLVDQIAADSAAGKLATPEEYLNAFPHLFKPAPTSTRVHPGN